MGFITFLCVSSNYVLKWQKQVLFEVQIKILKYYLDEIWLHKVNTFSCKQPRTFSNKFSHTVLIQGTETICIHQLPTSSCFQKSVYYPGFKIFNSRLCSLNILMDKKAQFAVAMKMYINTLSFYSYDLQSLQICAI
jgi:hypothetical protein